MVQPVACLGLVGVTTDAGLLAHEGGADLPGGQRGPRRRRRGCGSRLSRGCGSRLSRGCRSGWRFRRASERLRADRHHQDHKRHAQQRGADAMAKLCCAQSALPFPVVRTNAAVQALDQLEDLVPLYSRQRASAENFPHRGIRPQSLPGVRHEA